jgi:hypothetical protein
VEQLIALCEPGAVSQRQSQVCVGSLTSRAFGLLLLEESGVRAVDDQRPRPKKDRGENHEHPDDDERYQEMPGRADLARAVAVAHPSDDAAAPKRAPTSRRLTARHLDGHGPRCYSRAPFARTPTSYPADGVPGRPRPFDAGARALPPPAARSPGLALSVVALASLVYEIIEAGSSGWSNGAVIRSLELAGAGGADLGISR